MDERNARLEILQDLANTLTGVVVNEADPRNWPGGLSPVQELTRDEQGARITAKKGAALTVGLLQKVTDLLNATANPNTPAAVAALKNDDAARTEATLAEAQKEAAASIARLNIPKTLN